MAHPGPRNTYDNRSVHPVAEAIRRYAARMTLAVPEAEQRRFVNDVIPKWAAPDLKERLRAVLKK